MEKLGAAVADFEALPFDGEAASRFGTLVSLTLAADRTSARGIRCLSHEGGWVERRLC
jgi:hypothetical protein